MAESAGKARLTKAFVERAMAGAGGAQRLYWDTELTGFGLRVGTAAKAFIVQRAVRGTTKRVTVGRYGVLTVDEARARARKLIARMRDGVDPNEEARQEAEARRRDAELALTLRDAWDLYRGTLTSKRSAPRTTARYEHCLTRYLADWLDRPLRDLTRAEVRQRHQQLARDVAAGKYAQRVPANRKKRRGAAGRGRPGPGHLIVPREPVGANPRGVGTANDVFRVLRAVYNRARKERPELPENPCANVDWFRLAPPRSAIPIDRLRTWYAGVSAVENPVRRDYLVFALFTGLRRQSAAEVRWADVDLDARTLRVPRPKGGQERAFTLPLSDFLVALLRERRADNERCADVGLIPSGSPFVFPAFSATGHIAEPREAVEGVRYTIHDLRRTFITVAESLDVSAYAIQALVNHRQPQGTVTAGYVSIDVERLREPMQRITDRLRSLAEGPGPAKVVPLDARRRARP